jgi:hypothetical protein
MAYLNYKIDNLVNGVSSQPNAYRIPNQGDSCENFWPSILTSLVRRPGTSYIETLSESPWASSDFFHTIDRGPLQKYILRISTGGTIEVYNLLTGEKAVVSSLLGDSTYLHTDNPSEDIRALSIADSTVILNRSILVREDTELTPSIPASAVVWVKVGSAAGVYKIVLKDSLGASHTASLNVSSLSDITPESIAAGLVSGITASGYYSVVRYGHVLYISPDSRDIASIAVEDPIAGTGMEAVYHQVDQLANLPATAPEGYSVKISGDSNRNQDDYYVTFKTFDMLSSGELGRGSWVEAPGFAVSKGLDSITLPVVLETTGFNQFTLDTPEWGQRLVGDLDSAESPSFVGRTLGGLTFWQGRMVLFSQDSVSMSESGDFFNFYPTTTLVIPDSDRVDVDISAPKSGNILYAVPYQTRLILLTREVQFALYGDPLITPGTVSVHPVSYLPYDGNYSPVSIGRFLYFGHNQSESFRTYEFFLETDGVTYDHVDISSHAFDYVPKDVGTLSASSDLNTLCISPEEESPIVYLYKSYWQDSQKVQSAWFQFSFPGATNIISSVFVRNILYVILVRDGKTFLEAMEFTDDDTLGSFPFSPHLDSRVYSDDLVVTYNLLSNVSTFSHPAFSAGMTLSIISEDRGALEVLTGDLGVVTLVGDWESKSFAVGLQYTSEYTLPNLVVKPKGQSTRLPVDNLKAIQVKAVRVNYEDSLEFDLVVDQGSYGIHEARGGVAQLQEEDPSVPGWRLRDGNIKTIAGAFAKDVKITLRSRGAFPLKATSASYDLQIHSYQENL